MTARTFCAYAYGEWPRTVFAKGRPAPTWCGARIVNGTWDWLPLGRIPAVRQRSESGVPGPHFSRQLAFALDGNFDAVV